MLTTPFCPSCCPCGSGSTELNPDMAKVLGENLGAAAWRCPQPTRVRALQGGFGIMEEMCVNYVHYYPQTQLELCKSAVDPGYLHRYFSLVNR